MKALITLVLAFTATLSFTQSLLVEYDVLNSNKIIKTELIVNDTLSAFSVQNDNTRNVNEDGFLIKNKNSLVVYSTDRFMNIKFYIKDSLNSMKWELTSDTSTIMNLKCLSAKTNFRGRDYLAYYTPAFPLSEGPWKFGGLPGLILAIKSVDEFVEWKATKIIENYTTKVTPININKYDFLPWVDFVNKYKTTVDKFAKLVRSSGKLDNEAEGELKIETVEIFYDDLQTGKGIKF